MLDTEVYQEGCRNVKDASRPSPPLRAFALFGSEERLRLGALLCYNAWQRRRG
jgi:hypothetical protein